MKKFVSTCTLLIAFSIISTVFYGQESVMLKYNFKEGDSFKTSTTIITDMVQSMMGQEMKFNTNMETKSGINVLQVEPNGNSVLMVTVPSLKAKVNATAMGKESSQEKTDSIKGGMEITFSTAGKKISHRITDTAIVPGSVASMLAYTKLQVMPDRSINIGEKWNDKQIDTLSDTPGSPLKQMITTSETEYTLVGKEAKEGKELYKISYVSKMEFEGSGNQSGMDLFMEGEGKMEGSYYFDPQISMPVYTENVLEMNANISVSGQQNMTIPMSQMTKSVSIVEKVK